MNVIMGIGIPGSGKTTFLKPFAERNSYAYICPDDIRAEVSRDAMDHSKNREVWRMAYARTAEALQQGKTVVFDATFAKRHERRDFITFARKNGARLVQGVYAAVSLETAKERNRMRERVVPPHALERMHELLQKNPPSIEEGFDSVTDIGEFRKLGRENDSR